MFSLCMILYLYGDLAIYCTALSKSLRDVTCTVQAGTVHAGSVPAGSVQTITVHAGTVLAGTVRAGQYMQLQCRQM